LQIEVGIPGGHKQLLYLETSSSLRLPSWSIPARFWFMSGDACEAGVILAGILIPSCPPGLLRHANNAMSSLRDSGRDDIALHDLIIKVIPTWVGFFYQSNSPIPFPSLDLLFAQNRHFHGYMNFIIHKYMNGISLRIPIDKSVFMLPDTNNQVASDSSV
jgi:hypothetical protein